MNLFHPTPRMSKLRAGVMASTMASTLGLGYAELSFAQSAESLEEVVVTGSRIRRQDFTANSPIITVDESTFEETSTIGLDTILNQLPQFIPGALGATSPNTQQMTGTGGSQFAAGGIGPNAFQTPGTSSVNLRGLGPGRNLVLIDGRRGMAVDASMTVDLNSIPSAALQRIEVVSGGASAVYGADAIAGAVNFILKDNFEGLDLRTNYGITELGDAEEYRMSALFGANTPDDRGNVMVGMEHSSRGEGDYWERDWFTELRRHPNVGGSDFFYADTYLGPDYSAFPFNFPSTGVVNGIFDEVAPGSVANTANFYVNKDGSVYTGAGGNNRPGAYRYNGPLDVDGKPYRKVDAAGGLQQNQLDNWVSVPMTRYSMFARGRYELTDNVEVFGNLTMARSSTATQSQFTPAVFGWNARIPHGNGIYEDSLLNPATAISGYDPATGAPMYDPNAPTDPRFVTGGAMGLNCPALGGCTNSQAFPTPPEVSALLDSRPRPNDSFPMDRVLDFLGTRGSRNTTMNYQFQFGLEGELQNDWYWDMAVSYGESENNTKVINYANLERYRDIVQSPNYGRLFQQVGNTQGGGFSAGTGFCTSGLPIFDDFEVTQDCKDAILTTLSQSGIMEQSTFDANLGGDLMELPAGPLQFAAGVGFRAHDYRFTTSDDLNPSNFGYSVIGLQPVNATYGEIKAREIYGELLVPIVSDGPMGLRSLNLELGGRYSDFYTTSGGVETWKALGDWLITDWMRFRGGFQRATRAPNIRELFIGRTQDIFGAGTPYGDVCSLNNHDSPLSAATGSGEEGDAVATPAQAAQTLAICNSLMTDIGREVYYNSRPIDEMPADGGTGSIYITGNPEVNPESADTFTAGLVITSPFDNALARGLTMSVDWYRIEVEDMIASELTTTVVERCFDVELNPTGDPNNRYCRQMARDPANGDPLTIDISFTNETSAKLEGIDVNLNWNAQFADFGVDFIPGGLGVNLLLTVPMGVETRANANANWIDWKGYQASGGCPSGVSCTAYDYQAFTTFNWFNGPYNMSLRWQHYPDIQSGSLLNNPDSISRGVFSSYNVFALSGSYRLNDTITLMGGIENLFDKTPPLAGGNPNATPYPTPPQYVSGGFYDPLGRRFFVSANMSF